jgi:hypothetical protein
VRRPEVGDRLVQGTEAILTLRAVATSSDGGREGEGGKQPGFQVYRKAERLMSELWAAVKAVAKELVHRPDELHNDDVAAIAAAAIAKA